MADPARQRSQTLRSRRRDRLEGIRRALRTPASINSGLCVRAEGGTGCEICRSSTGLSDEAGLSEREADLQVRSERPQLYELVWRKEEKPRNTTAQGGSVHWIILADQKGVGPELARLLSQRGCTVTLVVPGSSFGQAGPRHYQINPTRPEDFERLWSVVTDNGAATRRVVHLWSLDAPPTDTLSIPALDHAVDLSVSSVVHVVQAAAKTSASRPTVWVVTRRAVAVDVLSARESLAIAQAPVWGLGRTVALEYPELWGGLIDVSHERHM